MSIVIAAVVAGAAVAAFVGSFCLVLLGVFWLIWWCVKLSN